MPNQIKIRPLKDKLRQFFSPIVYECSIFRNNGKPIGGFADENEIADAFSPTHSYVVGEPCIYENVVRICTTPHNGDWDASHFRSVSVMGYAQEVVKNLGMPPEYDPNYEYLLGDLCTHDGLWWRSLYGYSGGGAGAWDETKWERADVYNEILNMPDVLYSTGRISYGGTGTSTTAGTATVLNNSVSSLVPSGSVPLSVNIFRAVGASSYDDGTGYINTSGAVVFKPRVTQSNVTIIYSVSYKM